MTQPSFMEGYEPFATPAQLAAVEAVREHGSVEGAIRATGQDNRGFRRKLSGLRKRAALRGFSPEHGVNTPGAPENMMQATSILERVKHRDDGSPGEVMRWRKINPARERETEFWTEFAEDLRETVKPLAPVSAPSRLDGDNLMTVYPMGDPHIGMYAWVDEAGEDFDVAIATEQLERAMSRLVSATPNSEEALIVNLGDFFHADNSDNMTSRSGNILDVDTRWQRVMKMGAETMFRLVELALMSHGKVTVRNAIGNHDDHSSVMLSLVMDAYFRNNDRVVIDTSPVQHWYTRFGTTLLGVTHGDKRAKLSDLPLIMAHDRPQDWAASEHRYWLTGHTHKRRVEEHGGVLCESFRTLAARDAYATGEGYRSGRDMQAIVFARAYGEVERHRMDIAAIR